MAKLRYVCISDLHAGAIASLATNINARDFKPQPQKTSPVAHAFILALRTLIESHNRKHGRPEHQVQPQDAPQLILLGDIFDFAFSDRSLASQVFADFLKHLVATPKKAGHRYLFNENLIVVPGNHDHGLWTGARLANEAQAWADPNGTTAPGLTKATPAFTDGHPMGSPLLDGIGQRVGLRGSASLHYPNLGLLSEDGKKAVVLHHGHFTETLYRAMSLFYDILANRKRDALSVADLAAENANWIEFGWSTFGDSMGIGRDVALVYEYLGAGSEEEKLKDRAANALEKMITARIPMGGERRIQQIVRMTAKVIIDASFGAMSDEERFSETEYLTRSTLAGLHWYLAQPTRTQLQSELKKLPAEMTFIFGHTHKPFVDEIAPDGYATPVGVCNTGGWILDSPRLDAREGASIVLIDDNMNAVSVCLFKTNNSLGQSGQVELISTSSKDGQAFLEDIRSTIAQIQPLWDRLGTTADREYQLRQRLILQRTHQEDLQANKQGAVL